MSKILDITVSLRMFSDSLSDSELKTLSDIFDSDTEALVENSTELKNAIKDALRNAISRHASYDESEDKGLNTAKLLHSVSKINEVDIWRFDNKLTIHDI